MGISRTLLDPAIEFVEKWSVLLAHAGSDLFAFSDAVVVIEVLIQVLLQLFISYKSHSTVCALEFY